MEENRKIETGGLLAWSIVELILVLPFGLAGLILWIVNLKPAADANDYERAMKAKKTIKIVLWIGVAFMILPFILIFLIAIPNFSGIEQRTQVRADKATAAQVGKAVRVWYIGCVSDPNFADICNEEEVENGFVRLDDIDEIENFIAIMNPTSYNDGKSRTNESGAYYVTIINEENAVNAKIVVAIGPKDLNNVSQKDKNFSKVFNVSDSMLTEINYDGNGSGIAYIEP